MKKDNNEAIKWFNKALTLDPDYPRAKYYMEIIKKLGLDNNHGQMTPKEFYLSRYKSEVQIIQSLQEQRNDLIDVPQDSIAKNSLDFCEQIGKIIKSLLTEDEKRVLGDFYFGNIAKHLLSASVENVGNSYLVLIHRRLFNTINFVSDIFASWTITDIQRWDIMAKYFYTVAIASMDPVELPVPPKFHLQQEAIFSGFMQSALCKFVLCHELFHILPSHPIINVNFDHELEMFADEIIRDDWRKEFKADYQAALFPLRETELDGDLKILYTNTTISASYLFSFIMDLIEKIREYKFPDGFKKSDSHPPGALRARILKHLLVLALPQYQNVIEENYRQTERNFSMIFKKIKTNYY